MVAGAHLHSISWLYYRLPPNPAPSASFQYFQPAIDHIVIAMQRRHNIKFPIVFNTYQCYLKDSKWRLELDLARARKEKFWFAAKLVRVFLLTPKQRTALSACAQAVE